MCGGGFTMMMDRYSPLMMDLLRQHLKMGFLRL